MGLPLGREREPWRLWPRNASHHPLVGPERRVIMRNGLTDEAPRHHVCPRVPSHFNAARGSVGNHQVPACPSPHWRKKHSGQMIEADTLRLFASRATNTFANALELFKEPSRGLDPRMKLDSWCVERDVAFASRCIHDGVGKTHHFVTVGIERSVAHEDNQPSTLRHNRHEARNRLRCADLRRCMVHERLLGWKKGIRKVSWDKDSLCIGYNLLSL